MLQVAINWCICKGALPIPGAKNAKQAKEAAGECAILTGTPVDLHLALWAVCAVHCDATPISRPLSTAGGHAGACQHSAAQGVMLLARELSHVAGTCAYDTATARTRSPSSAQAALAGA